MRDLTLNEAMDSVLASAGLQSRTLDNSTVIIASTQAMVQLGLNRSMAKAFKLSYAHPYDVCMILHASIFNKGVTPDFVKRLTTATHSVATDEHRRAPAKGSWRWRRNRTDAHKLKDDGEGGDRQENSQSLRP